MSVPSTAPLPTAREPGEIFLRLAPQMEALDRFILGQVEHFEPEIRAMAAYCLESTGKRLRPSLVFLSGWRGEGVVTEAAVRAAGIVEMVHLATLVHDDIMDGAELRRNRRTAARAFGADAAVLLGDALFSQALHVAAQFPTPEVCRVVAESTRRVCSGEIMQTLHRRETEVSRADYFRVIDLKTAELFRVSCFLGARIADYPAAFVAAAESFGRHLGIAYQIYDDLVDVLGDEGRIGKTLGTDLASGKLTLPLMLLLEKLPAAERGHVQAALRGERPLPPEAGADWLRELQIADAVVVAVEAELVAAEAALAPFAELPPAPVLGQLTSLLRAQVGALHRGGK